MRTRRSFKRPEGKKSARLIVIAREGDTEEIYLNALKLKLCARNVHMEVLERDGNNSSPESVYQQLRKFMDNYLLEDDDELWMLIDRDKWEAKNLASIARLCAQNSLMHFAMSNPCFELWLLLHFEDVGKMSAQEIKALKENRRSTRRTDTWLKKRVRKNMGSFGETNYDADMLMPLVGIAHDRAEALDKDKSLRWPTEIGSRVYRLVESIMDKRPPR